MKQRMIKKDLVSEVCNDTHISRHIVEKVINSTLDNITLALCQGKEVQFAGFGTFEPKERAARTGKNLKTNELIPIPARVIPSFRAGRNLKQAVTK